jgi:thiol:disulfide interchange protein
LKRRERRAPAILRVQQVGGTDEMRRCQADLAKNISISGKLRHFSSVRFTWIILTAALICSGRLPAQVAHTQARLLLAADTAHAGDTILAGVQLHMDPGWHTYWKNPGNSGLGWPTTIDWQLPRGITAGNIQWPVPEKLMDTNQAGSAAEDSTTYIYNDEVVLLVSLKLAPNLPPGPLELAAKVSWLECAVQCLPGSTRVQAKLQVGTNQAASKDAELLASWERKLPRTGDGLSARVWWDGPAKGDLRLLVLQWNSATPVPEADFFPDSSEQFEMQGTTERLPAETGKIQVGKQVKKLSGDWPAEISGLLVQNSGPERIGYQVKLAVGQPGTISSAAPNSPGTNDASLAAPSLWKMLVYAFVGGLILNIMPCVLPVIALKILGFVGQAKDNPRRVRHLGIIYALGVLASFLALAGLVIGVKAAGHQAGWGMQFGNPQFLVVLTILVTLVALNLFGLFEVNLSGQVMGAAGTLASKHGAAGAFFNGVLATILATPCTAPFLSIALGFAFAQNASLIILTFLTIGLGLASPYVIISWHPAWLKFLPKPGAWMEKFKIAMGFPMLATAVWLFSLLPIHYGTRSWWLAIFLVILALAAWIFGEFFQRVRARRGLALAACLAVLGAGYVAVIEGKLLWRSPITAQPNPGDSVSHAPAGIAWQPWTPEAVSAARQQGRPVLVDFTAQWCLTCNTVVKPALENLRVRQRLSEINAVPMLGDYTGFPQAITDELTRFGRSGVPLLVVYSRNANEPPQILPDPSPLAVARPSLYSSVVLDYLERAVR